MCVCACKMKRVENSQESTGQVVVGWDDTVFGIRSSGFKSNLNLASSVSVPGMLTAGFSFGDLPLPSGSSKQPQIPSGKIPYIQQQSREVLIPL